MHTKYGVDQELTESPGQEKQADPLPGSASEVRCPLCQSIVYPQENYGGLLVCPTHGTAPFERKP